MSVTICKHTNYTEVITHSIHHVYTHYNCNICEYTTKRKDLIEKHVAIHPQEEVSNG